MLEEYSYRKCTIHDIDELVRLRNDFMKESYLIMDPSFDEPYKIQLYNYFEKALVTGEFIGFLALHDQTIVATGGLNFNQVPPTFVIPDGRIAYIQNVYTLPAYRNKGLANTLFKMLLNEARTKKYIYVSLHASEMGRPIYEKFGFVARDDEMMLSPIPDYV